MTTLDSLYLHEEALLLALRAEVGTIASGTTYSYAVAGAILAELLLRQRIGVENPKRKLVTLKSATPVGEPLLDEGLDKIATARRRASMQTWVSRFTGIKRLKHRVAAGLCERGILRMDEDKVLLLFKRRIYPEIDPAPENAIIERLRHAIFTEAHEVDPRTVVLVSLAKTTGLLEVVFDRKELKARRRRIEHVINGEMTGKAAAEAIDAMHAAVFVTCIMPR